MITSSSNSQLKNLNKLLQKTKARNEKCAFVVEGRKMFLETPDEMIQKVYLSELLNEDMPLEIGEKLTRLVHNSVDIETVSPSVFKSISDTVSPQGILCIAKQPKYELLELINEPDPLFIILENLQDPGNLGTIMRTAEGAGVTAVIMSKNTVDLFNPKVTRSTMGAIFRMPFVYVEDMKHTIKLLQEKGVNVFAAHLQDSVDYVEPSYKKGTAFLIGNEGNGLTDEICGMADSYIKIPMQGKVESLNASVAASLLMYEAYRQRRK